MSEILQNFGNNKKKRQRSSSSFLVVENDEKSSKLSKYDQIELELEAMFSDNNDARWVKIFKIQHTASELA